MESFGKAEVTLEFETYLKVENCQEPTIDPSLEPKSVYAYLVLGSLHYFTTGGKGAHARFWRVEKAHI